VIRILPAVVICLVLVPPMAGPMFEWPGACPTDCCGYSTGWTARDATPVWAAPLVAGESTTDATPAFILPAGTVVRAVTGTLYTLETGTARVRDDFSTDATYMDLSARHKQTVTFHAEETIELLAPRGAGVYRIRRNDRVLDANLYQVNTSEACAATARCAGVITKPPVTRWWVMVLDPAGRTGWIVDPVDRFQRSGCR
jgi:hypothetical protein